MWRILLLAALVGFAHQVPQDRCPNCISSKESSTMLRAHSDACLGQSRADPEMLHALFTGQPLPVDASIKAHVYCVLMRCKIITKDGKLHKSAVLAKMAGDPDGDEARKVLDTCAEQTGTTPEDIAMNIFRCFYDKKLFIFNYMPADRLETSNDAV